MAAEQIVLDDSDVAVDRTELDISAWVAAEGLEWGDSEVVNYQAEGDRGSTVVDYRIPNRMVVIPLVLKTIGATSFAEVRSQIQAKVALFQAEGGWLKRVLSDGTSTVYADVVSATLKLSGGWLQAHRDVDIDAVLTLECLPDFYGAEVTLDSFSETTLPEIATVLKQAAATAVIAGDFPARCRIVVTEADGDTQLGLLWGVRSKHYSSASTAALAYQAEALTPLDSAATAALTGASGAGSNTIRHNDLSISWTPVLNTNLLAGTFLTHTGSYRVWARVYTTSTTPPQCRFVWDVGDLTFPVENPPKAIPGATNFYLVDLGEIRLDKATGTHRWQGQVQAKGSVGGENVYVDRLYFQPLDEGAAVLRAPLSASSAFGTYAARDEFNQTVGALTGKTAPVGGVWTVVASGDATDFDVETTGKTAQRTAVSDTAARVVTAGTTNYTNIAVQADVMLSDPTVLIAEAGVAARVVDINNMFRVGLSTITGGVYVRVEKLATLATTLAFLPVTVAASRFYTIRMTVNDSGRWVVWFFQAGSVPGAPLAAGVDAALAAGGVLATGKVGLGEWKPSAGALTRNYDNFSAWVPDLDAVLHASQSAELTTQGTFRETADGTGWGPTTPPIGDLPRLPASGMEDRPVELFLLGSRGDLDQLSDSGIDDKSAQVIYRPCWLAPFS